MAAETILTVNGGSSSLKCRLFKVAGLESIRDFSFTNVSGEPEELLAGLQEVLAQTGQDDGVGRLVAVGHRVVHGGSHFDCPVIVDAGIMTKLRQLESLAPLHQPANLKLIDYCTEALPEVPQVACFDTAFHRHIPAVARNYALPQALTEAGLHGYGFHGLSYEYAWETLRASDEAAGDRRIIVAHLGAGASLCAIRGGRSIATTMGFSTADGVPMATRTGSIDPGLMIYLLRERELNADELERLIYKEGGLKAVSGLSGNMHELQASNDPRAREAIELFVYRIVGEIGRLSAALEGLDILVFTGGIGANDASIRQEIVGRLEWLDSEPDIRVIPANEEAMIATHTSRLLNRATEGTSQGTQYET